MASSDIFENDIHPVIPVKLQDNIKAGSKITPQVLSQMSVELEKHLFLEKYDSIIVEIFACFAILIIKKLGLSFSLLSSCSTITVIDAIEWSRKITINTDRLSGNFMLDQRQDIIDMFSCFQSEIDNAKSLLINTTRKLEGKYLDLLQGITTCSVRSVGPLILESRDESLSEFLDLNNNVVYISMGSNGTLQIDQLKHLHCALLQSGRSFVWSLSSSQQELLKQAVGQIDLPNGVIKSWINQTHILNHRSTSLFISHCGWNSVLEAVEAKVQIIGWPLFAEQEANSILLKSMGYAKVVEKTMYKDGPRIVSSDEVLKLLS